MAVVRKRGDSHQAIVRITIGGRKYEEARSFKSEKLARAWADKLEAKLKLEGVPQRVQSQMTLGELILAHAEKVGKFKRIPRETEWKLNRLAVQFARLRLSDMNPKVFTDFAAERAKEGVSGATILHDLATMRGVLSAAYAVQNIEVSTDPIAKACDYLSHVGIIHKSKSRSRRPSDDELRRVLEELERTAAHPSSRIPSATIVRLAIALPRRINELCRMTWRDYFGDTLILRDTKDPTAPRDEEVPVPPEAQAIIATLPRIDERILPYRDDSVSSAFERACDRLGIEDLRFHDLRHHGISMLFEKGLSIPEVAAISGHKTWTILKRYTNLKPQHVTDKLKEVALRKNNKGA